MTITYNRAIPVNYLHVWHVIRNRTPCSGLRREALASLEVAAVHGRWLCILKKASVTIMSYEAKQPLTERHLNALFWIESDGRMILENITSLKRRS